MVKIKIFILLLLPIIFSGCTNIPKKGTSLSSYGLDYISIQSIKPENGLIDGEYTDFNVEVEYELCSRNRARLMIGFNSDKVDFYNIIRSASKVINRGKGRHTFNVTVLVKNWSQAGKYKAFVSISPFQLGLDSSSSLFASDSKACGISSDAQANNVKLAVVILDGDVTLDYHQKNSFKAKVFYNGSNDITFKWYVYDTLASSDTETFVFSGMPESNPAHYPIKVIVSDGTLSAEDSITVTVKPKQQEN